MGLSSSFRVSLSLSLSLSTYISVCVCVYACIYIYIYIYIYIVDNGGAYKGSQMRGLMKASLTSQGVWGVGESGVWVLGGWGSPCVSLFWVVLQTRVLS